MIRSPDLEKLGLLLLLSSTADLRLLASFRDHSELHLNSHAVCLH